MSIALAASRERTLGRKLVDGDTSIEVVSDSTNDQTNGALAGQFCYFPWGWFRDYDGPMCGLSISSTLGNTRPGGADGILISGGSPTSFVDNTQKALVAPSVAMADGAAYPILGSRAEFVVDTGEAIPVGGPHYQVTVEDLAVPFPALGDWMAGKTARISIPIWRGLNGDAGGPGIVASLWWSEYQDFNDDATYTQVASGNRNYASAEPALVRFDTVNFISGGLVTNQRIRLQIRGHVPLQAAAFYEGRSIIFGTPWVWVEEEVESGLFIDCAASIGGYTVALHLEHHPMESWRDWFAAVPRPIEYAWIWLGNNDDPSALGDTWRDNLETLALRIEEAGIEAGRPVIPVIVVPPACSETWRTNRTPVHRAYAAALRAEHGWPVIDIDAMLGTHLVEDVDLVDAVHPNITGARRVCDAIRAIALAWSAAGGGSAPDEFNSLLMMGALE